MNKEGFAATLTAFAILLAIPAIACGIYFGIMLFFGTQQRAKLFMEDALILFFIWFVYMVVVGDKKNQKKEPWE